MDKKTRELIFKITSEAYKRGFEDGYGEFFEEGCCSECEELLEEGIENARREMFDEE